jgi:hypothetical protein
VTARTGRGGPGGAAPGRGREQSLSGAWEAPAILQGVGTRSSGALAPASLAAEAPELPWAVASWLAPGDAGAVAPTGAPDLASPGQALDAAAWTAAVAAVARHTQPRPLTRGRARGGLRGTQSAAVLMAMVT